jgi:hypothetical protein
MDPLTPAQAKLLLDVLRFGWAHQMSRREVLHLLTTLAQKKRP